MSLVSIFMPDLSLPSVENETDRDKKLRMVQQQHMQRMAAIASYNAYLREQNDFVPMRFWEPPPAELTGKQQLYDHVTNKLAQGEIIHPELARRYVHHVYYNEFSDIDLLLSRGGLGGMSLDDKLTLYESIAQECHSKNTEYLGALNAEMGLTDEFFAQEAEETAEFFSEQNLRYLARTHPKLIAGLEAMMTSPASLSEAAKANTYQMLSDAYCDFCEIPRKQVNCRHDPDSLLYGFYQPRNDSIMLNTNTDLFRRDPFAVIETLIHEARHGKQHEMGRAYHHGEIPRSHPSYVPARVFYANIKTVDGYVNPQYDYSGYHGQPAEIDARKAGEVAINNLRKNLPALMRQTAPAPACAL